MFLSPLLYSFTLLLSLSLICLFAPQILPPQNRSQIFLHQELDDLALFQKAIKPPRKISHLSTKNPTPKIAFLFLTNSQLTFSPLWERFFHGNLNLCNIYVHADPLAQVPIPNTPIFKTQFIPSKRTQRGSPSLISAESRLLARAIIDDPLNLYFALVSQHCIPLHSFKFMYNTLFGSNNFLAISTQSRHRSFIEIISEDPNLEDRYNARGENAMLPEIPFEKFRVGSQFFILAKRHVLIVLKDKKLWRKFKLPCLNIESCYPEEHYFPTLLSMADPKGCSHFTLTNVNWTGSFDGHPHMYQQEEISGELVHRLRQSNSSYTFFFARKFSPECLQPLMDIADDVIFRD